MGMLKITMTGDQLANWMVINNLLYKKKEGDTPPHWNGVLFSLTRQYESFPAEDSKNGLDRVVLSDAGHTALGAPISVAQFAEGSFLYIVVGNEPDKPPSKKPGEDAKQLWHESLHKHVTACKGGIILWKHRDNEVRIRLANESNANYQKYEFECDFDEPPQVILYNGDGTVQQDYSSQNVGYVDLRGYDDPDPKDTMNPPRYP